MKWGVRNNRPSVGGIIGKSYKVNEGFERKKAGIASKLGLKKKAQTYKNNAEFYKKTSNDLSSGKIAKPKTKYQKAMRWLGKTNFATKAILTDKKYLTPQMKAQALHEQHVMRKADGWYKKKAKQMAIMKSADIAIGIATKK